MSNELISEARVLQSAAGYYIGNEYWDTELEGWLPWSRFGDYYRHRTDAQQDLLYEALCNVENVAEEMAMRAYAHEGLEAALRVYEAHYDPLDEELDYAEPAWLPVDEALPEIPF